MLGRMTWTAPQITRQGTMYATGERQMLEAWLDFHLTRPSITRGSSST
jgi:hypothetical protein